MTPSLYQKFLALFYPIKLRISSGTVNPVLELYFFRGRYQLATGDALYSDGHRYRPLVAAFGALRKDFARIKSVLVLGTGLGSAAAVAADMGFTPRFTFVDIDAIVLAWAKELMPKSLSANATFVTADAIDFVQKSTACYDLIVVDVFIGRVVPDAVSGEAFLKQCRARLNSNGRLVMNYMMPPSVSMSIAKFVLEAVFGRVRETAFGLNRVYIADN